ncbi:MULTISPECIES: aldehyde dehydrogenase family protein [Kitasatospora]|uniref:Putative oxidoreductase n=1 Tax=Kitasatospora setae (strain ATCC 33774 / DSM 43861 / JCM 3304 / KCC A-0304 / NBRC 14216 / KM-6054) TaxID=452652 RepID=E4ND72_KITSK|nr:MULTISPECIES: aldehyde dehydrogenase family protein [Kitasatospora]BAJ29153.1 putative oxidoreductase [Kitasatospora setae KM-6054]
MEILRKLEILRGLLAEEKPELIALAATVETVRTAETEWQWADAGLALDRRQVAWLAGRVPLGTVHVRLPATLPLYSFVLFAVGALLPGNRVLVRPATASRHVVERVVSIARRAGLDVRADRDDWESFERRTGEDAAGVVFCGGPARAERLHQRLPERTRMVYQGPGCCAFVVAADADPAAAAAAVAATRLFNSSQDCLATERVYVADAVFDRFTAELDRVLDGVRYGPNTDPATDVGPLLLTAHAEDWYRRITDPAAGTVLRAGGRIGPDLYETSVLEAAADSAVVLEEKYCPILPLVRYRSDRELRQMLELGDFALGLTVHGRMPSFGTLDFGHVAIGSTQYDQENAMASFGGYRRTTFVRQARGVRPGPALVPFEMSAPAGRHLPRS